MIIISHFTFHCQYQSVIAISKLLLYIRLFICTFLIFLFYLIKLYSCIYHFQNIFSLWNSKIFYPHHSKKISRKYYFIFYPTDSPPIFPIHSKQVKVSLLVSSSKHIQKPMPFRFLVDIPQRYALNTYAWAVDTADHNKTHNNHLHWSYLD